MALTVEGLCKRFGAAVALEGASFQVPPGAVVGLVGPNGAGKTTAMRIVLGILQPDAGEVCWEGRPLGPGPRPVFGYLPEERGLYPRMRVREQLAFFGALHGLAGSALEEAIGRVTALLDLGPLLDRRPEELSRGNGQKVQMAVACLHRPVLVVLDEPFSGLDPAHTRLFKELVGHLRASGTAVLFSSHRMDHVEELCDWVAFMVRGRVVLQGSVAELRRGTGRRVVRLAWDEEAVPAADPDRTERIRRWMVGLSARGVEVRACPAGVWELSWKAGDPAAHDGAWGGEPDSDVLLEEARRLGRLRLFEWTYPRLEEVYLAVTRGDPAEGSDP